MSRSAVVLVWLFAARPAAGQAPYRVTWRDAASVGAAGALALIPVALNLPHGPPPCAPCDPASVPSIDRTALHNASAGAEIGRASCREWWEQTVGGVVATKRRR